MLHQIKSSLIKLWNKIGYERWLRTQEGRQNYARIQQLANTQKNKRCFIIGNGPSLLKCDVSKLKDEITIASNNQFLMWEEAGFKPTYYTIEDRLTAQSRQEAVNALTGPEILYPYDLRDILLPGNGVNYINFVRDYDDFPRFSLNFADVVYWGGTVSFLNMQLAYYLGCNEIYLVGFDHSYNVKKDANDVVISTGNEATHFHPDYFLKGQKWYDPNTGRMEKAYVKAKEVLQAEGVKVYNATVGGQLEVYERVDYNKLF